MADVAGAVLVDAGVVVALAETPGAALQRRRRGDPLERRSGRVRALNRPVEQREAAGGVVELLVLGLRRRLGEDVGVERRRGPHGQHLAVVGVQRHERARAGGRIVGDGLVERLLAGLLQSEVERQLERVPGDRLALAQVALEAPERIDLDAVGAVDAAQIAVVVPLQADWPTIEFCETPR